MPLNELAVFPKQVMYYDKEYNTYTYNYMYRRANVPGELFLYTPMDSLLSNDSELGDRVFYISNDEKSCYTLLVKIEDFKELHQIGKDFTTLVQAGLNYEEAVSFISL